MFGWYWLWDEYYLKNHPDERNFARYNLWKYPVIGDYYRWEQGLKDSSDYLRERGLTWADAQRVGNLPGAGDNPYSNSANYLYNKGRNFVSSNIYRLYR